MRRAGRWLLFDTGMGAGHEDLDAHYRPVHRPLVDALGAVGAALDEVGRVANCHLRFDHYGGNPLLAGRPVSTQADELETDREGDCTLAELVAGDLEYEPISGEAALCEGVFLVPAPGHVAGHQSLVVRCRGAGQLYDAATSFDADMLAATACCRFPAGWTDSRPLSRGSSSRMTSLCGSLPAAAREAAQDRHPAPPQPAVAPQGVIGFAPKKSASPKVKIPPSEPTSQ